MTITLSPMQATWPQFATGLVSTAQQLSTQLRGLTQAGRTWSEFYGPLVGPTHDQNSTGWLAQQQQLYQQQTIFSHAHPSQVNILGTGAGSPVVSGASQTGSSITSSGWAAGQTVLKAGDIINLPGLTLVFDVTADVTSSGGGTATIPINPPIWVGKSPTNGGAIVTNATPGAVVYRVRIAKFQPPVAAADEWYQGATIVFAEVP